MNVDMNAIAATMIMMVIIMVIMTVADTNWPNLGSGTSSGPQLA